MKNRKPEMCYNRNYASSLLALRISLSAVDFPWLLVNFRSDKNTLIFFFFQQVIKSFQNLKMLMIEHFHDSNEQTMEDICSCSKNLSFLTLALCPFYSNCLQKISNLRNLECLDLSSNISVDDELLAVIGANCRVLRKVDISCE